MFAARMVDTIKPPPIDREGPFFQNGALYCRFARPAGGRIHCWGGWRVIYSRTLGDARSRPLAPLISRGYPPFYGLSKPPMPPNGARCFGGGFHCSPRCSHRKTATETGRGVSAGSQSLHKGQIAGVALPSRSQPATQSGRADPGNTGGAFQRQATTGRIDKGQRDRQGQLGWSPPFVSAPSHRGVSLAVRTSAMIADRIVAGSRSQDSVTTAKSGSV